MSRKCMKSTLLIQCSLSRDMVTTIRRASERMSPASKRTDEVPFTLCHHSFSPHSIGACKQQKRNHEREKTKRNATPIKNTPCVNMSLIIRSTYATLLMPPFALFDGNPGFRTVMLHLIRKIADKVFVRVER